MASRIESFDVTFPAGTAIGSPVTVGTPFLDGVVVRLDVQVPDGPSGLMGWAVIHSQQQIIPHKSGQYVVANDSDFSWPLDDYPTGGTWSIRGYNLDIYDHTIHIQFLLMELVPAAPSALKLVPIT